MLNFIADTVLWGTPHGLDAQACAASAWDFLASKQAFAVYLVVLLAAVLFLVISVLVTAHAGPRKVSLLVDGEEELPIDKEDAALSEEATATEPSSDLPVDGEEELHPGVRFGSLSRIDEQARGYRPPLFNNTISLSEFCHKFRNYAASRRKLYYSIDDIRRFVAGLGVSPLLIMQGMSGTGKTSLATAFGAFIGHDSTVIPIQPMWKERSDMIGYFNEFTERFNETELLCRLYEAGYHREMSVIVLDEMNIARVEYYFADFLSLLELPDPSARKLDVVSDTWEKDPLLLKKGKLIIPPNVWYIGTANNDDSTFAISDKVYDRAMIINLDHKAEPFDAPATPSVPISYDYFGRLIKEAQHDYGLTRRSARKLEELDEYMVKHFRLSFGNRIMKQIRQYVPIYIACGGKELEALDDIFSKKILRKLEYQNPVYIRNAAEGLTAKLDELFGTDAMPACKAYLERLCRSV